MSDLRTLGVPEICKILHKSPDTIYMDVKRRPNSLPPRLVIPGSRTLLWLESDVHEWLVKCRQKQKGRPRENTEEFA
jgi:predicted DNA-binding transcriptional regulator AlpA